MKKILLSAILIATALTSFAQVGIGTNTPNVSAALDVESTTLGFLPPRMTRAEMTAIATPAEGLTVYCNDCTPKSLYFFDGTDYIAAVNGTVVSISPPSIGDFRDGGVVIWLDGSGGGLVCALSDQSTGIQWYNGSYTVTGATATGIGTGQANTTTIVSNLGAGSYAAELCDNLSLNGFSDWYLPSKNELNEMHRNKVVIDVGLIANGGTALSVRSYWSSSEDTNTNAWIQYLDTGNQFSSDKYRLRRVRAIRAF